MDAAWILLVLIAAGVNPQPAKEASNTSTKPVEHRVNFAGQANWSGTPTTAPPAVSFDRYGQPITQAAQSVSDRTQTAISQSGAALKDGFDAGVRATSQQLSSSNPFATSTATGASAPSGVSSPWVNNSAAPPAPNWQSNPAAPGIVATEGNLATATAASPGWSSIGSSVAAPKLLTPQSPMNFPSYGTTAVSAGRSGPGFPAVAAGDQPPLHSVLAEPPSSTARSAVVNRADDLATGWSDNSGGQQPSIRASSNQPSLMNTGRESDLVPITGNNTAPQDPRYTNANRTTSSFPSGDGWPQQPQPNLSAQPPIESASASRQLPPPPVNSGMGNPAVSSPFAGQSSPQQTQPQTGLQSPPTGNFSTSGTNPNINLASNGYNPGPNSQKGNSGQSEQAWVPLILAVLTLAGSLAANLFLGMSYLDARQKYQSLVRKTADTFRRVKAAAA